MTTISIYGSGNTAWSLGRALASKGIRIAEVISRNEAEGQALAKALGATHQKDCHNANPEVDLLLLAVSDDAISTCAQEAQGMKALAVHTSGRTPMSALSEYGERIGVFYPLQSMKKESEMDFSEVPFLLETARKEDYTILEDLAHVLSQNVQAVDSVGRLTLHTAAVLVNNFVNHLNASARDLCESANVPFDLLFPLIEKTAQLALEGKSAEHQTGPALRNDTATIEDHRSILKNQPDLLTAYNALTHRIQQYHETKL